MKKFGESLSSQRKKKKISIDRAATDLVVKKTLLEALEKEDWTKLPEPAFVKGYIKSYAQYLGLDIEYILALYRREFDETKFPIKKMRHEKRRFFITPPRIINFAFALAIVTFLIYLVVQYSSVFSSPKLEITSPKEDETISVPAIQISGVTEKDATVSINGKFVAIDENGNFSTQYMLTDGKNQIEIIASFRLSPKTKAQRTVRLIH